MPNFNYNGLDLSVCSADEIKDYALAYEQNPAAMDALIDWPGIIGNGARKAKACYNAVGETYET